ncbi:hypothetical protein V6Z12_A03G091100 [Gossypium hirsutum]
MISVAKRSLEQSRSGLDSGAGRSCERQASGQRINGVSTSSLGYLFGSGESPKPSPKNVSPSTGTVNEVPQTQNEVVKETPPPAVVPKDIPAGIPGNNANNYFRADGQNCGNFLTDRPTIKVHAAPGGGSSLDYLFGGNPK